MKDFIVELLRSLSQLSDSRTKYMSKLAKIIDATNEMIRLYNIIYMILVLLIIIVD